MTRLTLTKKERAKHRFNYEATVGNRVYRFEYGPRGIGPRGGMRDRGWQVLEYEWVPPDEYNENASLEFVEDHFFGKLAGAIEFVQGKRAAA